MERVPDGFGGVGPLAYAVAETINGSDSGLWSVDVTSGNSTLIGTTGVAGGMICGLARDPPSGQLYGTDGRGVLHRTAAGTINVSERAGRFNERIRMMYEDTKGVLWIATQNGVERSVAATIVDEEELARHAIGEAVHHGPHPLVKGVDRLLLVVDGADDGEQRGAPCGQRRLFGHHRA